MAGAEPDGGWKGEEGTAAVRARGLLSWPWVRVGGREVLPVALRERLGGRARDCGGWGRGQGEGRGSGKGVRVKREGGRCMQVCRYMRHERGVRQSTAANGIVHPCALLAPYTPRL